MPGLIWNLLPLIFRKEEYFIAFFFSSPLQFKLYVCLPFRPFWWPTLTFSLRYTTPVLSQAQFLLSLPPFSDPLPCSLPLYPEDPSSTTICLPDYTVSHQRRHLNLNNHCCYSVLYITQLKNCPNIWSIIQIWQVGKLFI